MRRNIAMIWQHKIKTDIACDILQIRHIYMHNHLMILMELLTIVYCVNNTKRKTYMHWSYT